MITNVPKTIYSEHEAAVTLGITVEELRSLVKNHIVKDEELPEDACAALKPADLLLLKVLSGAGNRFTAV